LVIIIILFHLPTSCRYYDTAEQWTLSFCTARFFDVSDALFYLGSEVVTYNNMIGGAAASANVPPVNLANLAPPKDEPHLSESARSTLSNRSWITDDKWSDDDDEDEVAGAAGFMPGAAVGSVAPPAAVPGSQFVSGNSSSPPRQQVLLVRCILCNQYTVFYLLLLSLVISVIVIVYLRHQNIEMQKCSFRGG